MNLSILFKTLSSAKLYHDIITHKPTDITDIAFLDVCESTNNHTLYIGTIQSYLASYEIIHDDTILILCNFESMDNHIDAMKGCLYVTPQTEHQIFQTLNQLLEHYRHIEYHFLKLSLAHTSVNTILKDAGKLTGYSYSLYSDGGHLIASSRTKIDSSPSADVFLSKKPSFYYDSGAKIPQFPNSSILISEWDHTYSIMTRIMDCNDITLGHLLMRCEEENEFDSCTILSYIKPVLAEAMLTHRQKVNDHSSVSFSNNLNKVLEGHVTDSSDIRQLLYPEHQANTKTTYYYRISLFSFNENRTIRNQHNELILSLKGYMKDTKFGVFRGDVVALSATIPQKINGDTLDYNQLYIQNSWYHSISQQYNVRACIGVSTSKLNRLHTEYMLCQNTLELTSRIPEYKDLPLIYVGDFNALNIIDYACQHFSQIQKHNEFPYLCKSELVTLVQYDKQKNSNLSDVLYTYLLNNRNIELTAKQLFMHRNTITNKLDKIHELTGMDLTKSINQTNILISILLLKYYENYTSGQLSWNHLKKK